MSDLYLVLRRRLDDVTEWRFLGTDVMRDARKEKGLSYEGVSRLVHVSSKTYERWEKRGEVPRHEVENVAEALGLEIERSRATRISLVEDTPRNGEEDRQSRMEGLLEEVLSEIRELRREREDGGGEGQPAKG